MPAAGHPPNLSMLPVLVNRYAICTVPALQFTLKKRISFPYYFMAHISVYYIVSKNTGYVKHFVFFNEIGVRYLTNTQVCVKI